MNVVIVTFRDNEGVERCGELVNPHTVIDGFVEVEYPSALRLDVVTFSIPGVMQAHSLEMSAVIRMDVEMVAA